MKHRDKVLIFDLDGTLLDTLYGLHAGFNHALKSFGYKECTVDEIRSFVGSGIRKALQRAIPGNVNPKEFEEITKCFKNYYIEIMYEYTKPYEGIKEMLYRLKSEGYKLAVVSNKYDEAVKNLTKRFFDGFMDSAIGECEGIRLKPESDGIIKAACELNINIEDAIYSGDSETDIQTSKNANIPCISVTWGFKDEDFLLKNGAKYIAYTPRDIIKTAEEIYETC